MLNQSSFPFRIILLTLVLSLNACTEQIEKTKETKQSWMEIYDKSELSNNDFVLFELFTSESCYDCPPAQQEFQKFIERNYDNKNIICISEHVDYWNSLVWGEGECRGMWIDKYSDGFHATRQFLYANKLNTGAGTPQIVANGKALISDPKLEDFENLLSRHQQTQNFTIQIGLTKDQSFTDNTLSIDYQTQIDTNFVKPPRAKYSLLVFLVQNKVETTPNLGENCNKNLRSHFVARAHAIATIKKKDEGQLSIQLPKDIELEHCRVVAFVQEWKDLNILAASSGFSFKKADEKE